MILDNFASSATVYGDPASVPIIEAFARAHTNRYGHSKRVIKGLLSWAALRSLDPMGADAWRWQSANPLGYRA